MVTVFEAAGQMPHIMVLKSLDMLFHAAGKFSTLKFQSGPNFAFFHFGCFQSQIIFILFTGVAQVRIRSPSSKEAIFAAQCWPSRGDTCMNWFLCFGHLPLVSYMSLPPAQDLCRHLHEGVRPSSNLQCYLVGHGGCVSPGFP